MNIDNIRLLAEMLNANGLTKLKVTEGDTTILLEKAIPVSSGTVAVQKVSTDNDVPVAKESKTETLDFNKIIEVKSPIVGVFYSKPSPDAEDYIKNGSKVKKGDVLCIVEAMKLMNEVTAESDGEIVDICIKSGEIAEYGQVLFKMF